MKQLDWKDEAEFFNKLKDRYVDGLEFCRIAYDLFEYVKEHDQDGYELSKRPRNIKELIEEILPISVYVRAKYRLGNYIQVCWTSRTACFDAEIKVIEESYFLEVTCAVHPKEYLVRELLNKQGYCYAADGVKKIGICCELDIGYFSKEWNILEEKVRALNIEHNFKEIFIYDSSTEKSFTMS